MVRTDKGKSCTCQASGLLRSSNEKQQLAIAAGAQKTLPKQGLNALNEKMLQ